MRAMIEAGGIRDEHDDLHGTVRVAMTFGLCIGILVAARLRRLAREGDRISS
ncbi:MAG: hypothetical protein HYR85_13950 [Planctomycetes bacterium]|nr:hypothetical protein [Planctomycetota bacterium]MBI3843588.1 hypothetical protein [Planctomycetota bacterium]